MSFLTPIFLFGAAAIALPIVFHLIRRTSRERTLFSSLLFLQPTLPRVTRRSRLEHLVLLLLRCLVVGLLAAGFGRPFFRRALPAAQPPVARRILILVDTSASMRRANLWRQACDQVQAVLRGISPADQVALFSFDLQMTPLVSFEQWNAAVPGTRAGLVSGRLAGVTPGWSGTRLGLALTSAAEALADTAGKAVQGRIVLISDLQEGSRLGPLQGYEWPKGVELAVIPLKPESDNNASVQWVPDLDLMEPVAAVTRAGSAPPNGAAAVRLRVSNAPDSRREQFQVGWARPDGRDFAGKPLEVYVPAGQSRAVALPLPEATRPGGQPAAADPPDRILLRGDDEDFDNMVFVVPPLVEKVHVLYCGADAENDPTQPLYFLRRAFQETRRQAVEVEVWAAGARPPAGALETSGLIVVGGKLSDENAGLLRAQVLSGKTLLFILRNSASAATLARLLGVDRLQTQEVSNYALLADIDFRHPLFAPFADPRFSDFSKIHFWKYRRLDAGAIPGARVVAGFDSGDPALVEAPVGRGRVLALTSGWQPDDSQLALSTKFVPLVYGMLELAGAPPPGPSQYQVGDAVPLGPPAGPGKSPSYILRPDNSKVEVAEGETNFSQTWLPGIYTLASTQPARRFAVNLDPAESRTAPLPVDEFERLGAPLARAKETLAREAGRKVRLQDADLENRQKLWRWLLVAAMALLLFETWLAGRAARRAATATAEGAGWGVEAARKDHGAPEPI